MTVEELNQQKKHLNIKPDDFYIEHSEALSEVTTELHKLLDHAPNDFAVARIHESIDALQAQVKYNDHMQCSKQSCSFCCHSQIFIGRPEAEYIKKHGKYVIDKERQAKQLAAKQYSDLSFADKACIMLKDGKCQVYEHRPALCRNHGILIGEDPHQCFIQSRDFGVPGTAQVCIQQPRIIVLEGMATYISTKGATSLSDIKNIAEWDL